MLSFTIINKQPFFITFLISDQTEIDHIFSVLPEADTTEAELW